MVDSFSICTAVPRFFTARHLYHNSHTGVGAGSQGSVYYRGPTSDRGRWPSCGLPIPPGPPPHLLTWTADPCPGSQTLPVPGQAGAVPRAVGLLRGGARTPLFGPWWSASGGNELTYHVWDSPSGSGGLPKQVGLTIISARPGKCRNWQTSVT
jgi:hypothetical protein